MKTVVETLAVVGGTRVSMASSATGLNGLTDSVRRNGKIEWLHFRHEEVAAFAAGADAHLTGELVLCAGSCGPGNLHLINGGISGDVISVEHAFCHPEALNSRDSLIMEETKMSETN